MDRFESLYSGRTNTDGRHLHSNMDRFERLEYSHRLPYILQIYIPIWIDLKGVSVTAVYISLLIYIPIWIDLKECYTDIKNNENNNLHSNMDRFERRFAPRHGRGATHLHSNMDRFESKHQLLALCDFNDLHSNMDRFESEGTARKNN